MKKTTDLIEFEQFEIEQLSINDDLSKIVGGGKGIIPFLGDIVDDLCANGWNCGCNTCNTCNNCPSKSNLV